MEFMDDDGFEEMKKEVTEWFDLFSSMGVSSLAVLAALYHMELGAEKQFGEENEPEAAREAKRRSGIIKLALENYSHRVQAEQNRN